MSEKNTDDESLAGTLATVSAIGGELASMVDGIALPSEVKKSIWKAIGTLIHGTVDLPRAWLAAKTRAIEDDAAAQSLVTKKLAESVAKVASDDPTIVSRAAQHWTQRLTREQHNREAITKQAVEHLQQQSTDQASSAEQIDDDWLFMFARHAEQRSNANMQRYFARLLAGEVSKPGSFSQASVQILGNLTPATADLFTKLCDISSYWIPETADGLPNFEPLVICEPFGPPGDNSLQRFGLSYKNLLRLQEAGLIVNDLTSHRICSPATLPDVIAGVPVQFMVSSDEVEQKLKRCRVVFFTSVGIELRTLVDTKPNGDYFDAFKIWAEKSYKIEVRH